VRVADQFEQVVIFDVFDFIGEADKAAIDVVERATIELVAELFAADGECMTAGVLAQHEFGVGHADGFRSHDLVGQGIFQHAILMDAGFVREGVASDNGFVGLDGDAGDLAEQLAGGKKMLGGNSGFVRIAIVADAHGHDQFFERGVACALTDAIDGALDLAGSGGDGGHGVGDGHAEIVVAVGGDSDALDSLDATADGRDQFAELGGNRVADGVGNIERGGAGFDDGFQNLAKEFGIGAGGVFGRKFDVVTKRFGKRDRFAGVCQTFLAADAQLVLQVNVGGGEEDVNAWASGMFQCFPGTLDIGAAGAGQSGDDGSANDRGNGFYGGEVAIGGDGKPGFDHVDAEAVELVREAQLFLMVHAATGGLLSIAERGVENDDAKLVRSHEYP